MSDLVGNREDRFSHDPAHLRQLFYRRMTLSTEFPIPILGTCQRALLFRNLIRLFIFLKLKVEVSPESPSPRHTLGKLQPIQSELEFPNDTAVIACILNTIFLSSSPELSVLCPCYSLFYVIGRI